MEWKTQAGNFTSTEMAQMQFILLELQKQTTMEHDFHLVPDELAGRYDVIIGIDMMSAIGVKINFSTQEIEWDGATAPMKDREQSFEPSEIMVSLMDKECFDSEAVLAATQKTKIAES